MEVSDNRTVVFGSIALLLVVFIGGIYWMNTGYGEVSKSTYEFAKALYSACLRKNVEHLDRVEQLVNEASDDDISIPERSWLGNIIGKARDGDWNSAAEDAKRIMTDQVKY